MIITGIQDRQVCMTPEVVKRLSPSLTEQIKRCGQYLLDMATQPEPLQLKPLFVMSQ